MNTYASCLNTLATPLTLPVETVLKPVGDIARLIERASIEDLLLFTLVVGKQIKASQPAPRHARPLPSQKRRA